MASFRRIYTAFVLLSFIASQMSYAQQTTNRTHVQRCASYREDVYTKVYTYSVLVYGVPDIETRVDKCKQPRPFILGGTPANPKEFPHMARLGFAKKDQQTKWFCGGTLISNKYVLTAAHCFHSPSGTLNVIRLGELVFNSETDDARPEDFEVERYDPHPEYDRDLAYNDIGLVKLKRLVTFSEYIAPSCLPTSNGNNFNKFCVTGWGSTKFAGANSDVLYKVTLDRIDDLKCQLFVDSAESDNLPDGLRTNQQLCAGSASERKDACQGDSGGPLLQIHDKFPCMHSVFGITSTGFGCGVQDTPGIYTRVHHYVDWIEKNAF